MNRTQLKNYAPAARRDFIAAITSRARTFGITKENIAEANIQGDVLMIEGRPFPVALASLRKKLVARIRLEGFDQVIQAMAYTWFNRFVAIRYMELHGYLDHGYRVLSHPQGQGIPEILLQASHVDLPGLNKEQVIDWQLDGNKDAELYRILLIAQCNALHQAMPFLFERIDDETELLLPDNLLHSDSVIRKLANSIDEESWNEIEIIGWLYQFYISERKDQVMGKVVASADIPAATQLFTPNWIVKYLVQNSIGAQWLATYPDSDLKQRMAYYIEPAEQTEDVKQQLAAITPNELNPEELTLIDPACGSGHILVEAYDLFKAIYQERGYPRHKIPQLILEKNLYGLDIDIRAAQMAGFALLMKARADSPRILSVSPVLNVYALHDSKELDDKAIAEELYQAAISVEGGDSFDHGQLFGGEQLTTEHSSGLTVNDIQGLIRFFENGTTFGSLLTVPEELKAKLPQLQILLEQVLESGNALARSHAQEVMEGFLKPAQLLAAHYDAVVANPPYMGGKGMNAPLKNFAKEFYRDAKADLFACFIERGFTLAKPEGHSAMVTMQGWMFLATYQLMREKLLETKTINTMAHLGARAFGSISGEVVQAVAFSLKKSHINGYIPIFFRLVEGDEKAKQNALLQQENKYQNALQDDFARIPSSPLAYWISPELRNTFKGQSLGKIFRSEGQNKTANNDLYLRLVWEVDSRSINERWRICSKGGSYKKWYGNVEYTMDWSENARIFYRKNHVARIVVEEFWYKPGITWTDIASGTPSFRIQEEGWVFETAGPTIFFESHDEIIKSLALLNSHYASEILHLLNPSYHLKVRDVAAIPNLNLKNSAITKNAAVAVTKSREDWNSFETSWGFQTNPLITTNDQRLAIKQTYTHWQTQNQQTITEMKALEEENNRLFIDAYGLQDELTPDVPIEQITLTVNPPYRYGKGKTEAAYEALFYSDTMEELVSYAIGCMMGRYALDKPGLVYAHAGNKDFDASQYLTFPADDDGIIPITDTDWFADDACNRLVQFIETVWPKENRDENLMFLAEGLGKKAGEKPVDTLRRYLSRDFFKDHLKTYKKRPIYWLFSSGKHKAFECLVYLHRYNEGTLSRMRMDYVQPLLGKFESRIKMLQDNIASASSTSARKKMEKELTLRQNQQLELRKYDEQLRYFTDQRIALDLDDGVKVNYGKFGTLLANVKDVTGVKG